MSVGSFKKVSKVFQGCFKGGTRKIERCSLRPKKFQGHLKKVSSLFKKNVNNKFQGCSHMYLIAATRAEGGLVFKCV